jgi:hypothetical protein
MAAAVAEITRRRLMALIRCVLPSRFHHRVTNLAVLTGLSWLTVR